jgi:hypothetical protein
MSGDWKTPQVLEAIKTRNIMYLAGEEQQGNVPAGTTQQVTEEMLRDSNLDHAIEFMKDNPAWLEKLGKQLALKLEIIQEYLAKTEKKTVE